MFKNKIERLSTFSDLFDIYTVNREIHAHFVILVNCYQLNYKPAITFCFFTFFVLESKQISLCALCSHQYSMTLLTSQRKRSHLQIITPFTVICKVHCWFIFDTLECSASPKQIQTRRTRVFEFCDILRLKPFWFQPCQERNQPKHHSRKRFAWMGLVLVHQQKNRQGHSKFLHHHAWKDSALEPVGISIFQLLDNFLPVILNQCGPCF